MKVESVVTNSAPTRMDLEGVVKAFRQGHTVKIVRCAAGWSVLCPAGILSHAGVDVFPKLESLANGLQEAGITRALLEL